MLQTLRGWMSNAGDRLDLMWTEPLSWIVMLVTVAAVVRRRSRLDTWREPVAMAGIGLWAVAVLAITVYPLDFEAPSADRFEISSAIPFAGTVQSIAQAGDRLMSDQEYEEARARVARDFGMRLEDVQLDRVVHGPGLLILRDPIGNIVMFMPLGLLLPLLGERWRHPHRILLAAVAASATIEISQALFGLGSVGTIDDVIANSAGAMVGYGLFAVSARFAGSRAGAAPAR